MMEEKIPNVCPHCGGAGYKIVKTIHGQTGMPTTSVQWCNCMKSRLVSEAPNCRLLAFLGDEYPKKINPEFDFNKKQNLLVMGDYDTFRLNVKGVVMNYRFHPSQPKIYCCHAIELLQNFYVKQEEGHCLADVEQFDLLVFALGTKEKNSQLNTVISEVVYSRLKCKRPTWIYLPKNLADCTQEYSSELEEHLKSYKKIRIESSGIIHDKSVTKNEASSFIPK